MKKLPIGIQTFSKIIAGNYYYVDKTELIAQLTEQGGGYYFLSRPRRFGKSLFLDTLKEAYSGNRELFQGLYLENNWDWSKKHPVVKISFGSGVLKTPEILQQRIHEILYKQLQENSLTDSHNKTIAGKFSTLLENLHKKYSQKAVVLIDEYDKPILDNITDTAIATQMRDELKNLYSVLKDADAHIQFVFITGVSKFSKVNLFSGLNNLEDISLNENFATICGYTQEQLNTVFQDKLGDVDMVSLQQWYNGYNFLGDSVYNPYDVLLYLKNKKFKNYWFETGSPSFLLKLVQERQYTIPLMESIKLSESALDRFDVNSIELETLLLQTGYLTIKQVQQRGILRYYHLTFPNLEVKHSLNDSILHFLIHAGQQQERNKDNLYTLLEHSNVEGFEQIFHAFFASIPHDWYRKNTLANYEGYYASIFYTYFTAIGVDVKPEDVTNNGQVDMTVLFEDNVYVFEFKVIELTKAGSALAQIKEKKYYEKYLTGKEKNVFLIGVEFSKDERNITNYEWEKL
ncbi:MAG: ATP-binding protein [Spirochaetota bacterium]